MLRFLYRFFLFLLHSFVIFESYLESWYNSICKWRRCSKKDVNLENIRKDSASLSKRPRHLALLLNDTKEIDCESLVDILTWSIALQISYITVYKQQGEILNLKQTIFEAVNSRIQQLLGAGASNLQLKISDCGKPYENGIVFPKQICIQLLSEDDHHQDLKDVCKSLTADDASDITKVAISSRMKVMKNLPDPDLAFQFGDVQSLRGFSPWHTHLTELLWYTSHHGFSYDSLMEGLRNYDRCQQRFGK